MRPRIYTRRVRETLGRFPAAAVLGTRQSGKTTLARRLRGVYFDMETAGGAARLDAEWDALAAGRRLVVVDEAQPAPAVFTACAAPSTPTGNATAVSCCSGPCRRC